MTEESIKFDAVNVPLRGRNLIEASAGTGKTYSIAILVLRMILENDIDIKNILMVTYTKAAVAELQERIRRFVREAHRYSKGEFIDDETIKIIVDESKVKYGNEIAEKKLRSSVLLLDETSVLTTHSFCQQALTEFAFETKQIFGAEAQTDFSFVIEEEVNKFWRKHVTTIHLPVLKVLIENSFDIKYNPLTCLTTDIPV